MNTTVINNGAAYFTAIDYGVLVLLLSLSLLIGIYFGFFSDNLKTAEDYLVGGHKMKSIPIAISLVARYLDDFLKKNEMLIVIFATIHSF